MLLPSARSKESNYQLVVLPLEYGLGINDGYAVVYNPRPQVINDMAAVFGR